jgi:hypothetical protein
MSKQMTLFGAWKKGTADQQRALDEQEMSAARQHECRYCRLRCAGAGPLELHMKTQHYAEWQKEKGVFARSTLSLDLQQSLVDLLAESRGDEVAAVGDDEQEPEDLQQFVQARRGDDNVAADGAVQGADGRRGALKRHRYTVKHKYNTVMAIQRIIRSR